MLKELKTCPLGSECQKIVGDTIHTCMWFMKLKGTDPQTGELVDLEQCAIVSQALLIMDNTKATYGVSQSNANLAGVLLDGKEVNNSPKLISEH